MSIWTAPFQDPIDQTALEHARLLMGQAATTGEQLRQLLHLALHHSQAGLALFLPQGIGEPLMGLRAQ